MLTPAFIFVLTLWPAHAQNVILGDPYTAGLLENVVAGQTVASGFTVGANDIQITSVGFPLILENAVSDSTAAYIFLDSGALPGATVGSLQQTVYSAVTY